MSIQDSHNAMRARRAVRVRSKVRGTADRPRLSVFRSNRAVWAQVIDDGTGRTLASAGSVHVTEKGLSKKDQAAKVGELLAQRAKAAGVERVVFDRGPYLYHGRVRALADGARQAGLDF
ncbi:MAG: 50S ribosomal protein L18 [Actinobacteria bacterium RBG_16_64_13]|nr:MAG: 50S ribosomal protein L18 [Actinobacteria bacterium RBG_16_64_13]